MAVQTYTEQLESVQAAISAIEAGEQAFSLNGRTVSRADLKTLYQREQWLRKMADRETRGGVRMRQAVPRG